MNQFEKYKPVWKIWTSLKKFKLEVNLNHNKYMEFMFWKSILFNYYYFFIAGFVIMHPCFSQGMYHTYEKV